MKALILIELDDENTSHYGVSVYHYTSRQFVHVDVPIKPMPERKIPSGSDIYNDYVRGWNDCLKEINET